MGEQTTIFDIIENTDNCSKGYLNILPTKNKVKFGFKKSYNQNVPAIIESLNDIEPNVTYLFRKLRNT